MSKNVGNLTQRSRRFRPRSRFDRLSHQRYEFLMRSGCVEKGMAVWDNGLKPLLGANHKWVISRHCANRDELSEHMPCASHVARGLKRGKRPMVHAIAPGFPICQI